MYAYVAFYLPILYFIYLYFYRHLFCYIPMVPYILLFIVYTFYMRVFACLFCPIFHIFLSLFWSRICVYTCAHIGVIIYTYESVCLYILLGSFFSHSISTFTSPLSVPSPPPPPLSFYSYHSMCMHTTVCIHISTSTYVWNIIHHTQPLLLS